MAEGAGSAPRGRGQREPLLRRWRPFRAATQARRVMSMRRVGYRAARFAQCEVAAALALAAVAPVVGSSVGRVAIVGAPVGAMLAASVEVVPAFGRRCADVVLGHLEGSFRGEFFRHGAN